MKTIPTVEGKMYCVATKTSCDVTTEAGTLLGTAEAGHPLWFQAQKGATTTLSDDHAEYSASRFNSAPAAVIGGGGYSSGERVAALVGSELTMSHATWFSNTEQSALSVNAAEWKNRVLTCYLKTTVPVSLSGVSWLYGQPVMEAGFIYVLALQQVDASTILANLAYTISK